jgi:hypothetical protein
MGCYWTEKQNQNAECSLKRKRTKLVPGFNNFLKKSFQYLAQETAVSEMLAQTAAKLLKLKNS